MQIYYISAEGNTDHFVKKMSRLFHNADLHRIDSQTDLFKIKHYYFVFVPTYVTSAGNSTAYREDEQTLPMHDLLAYQDNYKRCLGVVGSGNRNFGVDCYCWTAKYYAERFSIPYLAHYELRGTMKAENGINKKLVRVWNDKTGSSLISPHVKPVSPRLLALEKKYGKDLQGKQI